MSDVLGCVKEWRVNVGQLSEARQIAYVEHSSLLNVCPVWMRMKDHLVVFLGMCHSSTRPSSPGTSLHVMRFTPVLVLHGTNAGVRWPGCEARLDLTEFHMNIHCTLQSFTSQSFRNPFDISRDGLLGQLARMRTNFLRASPTTPNLIEEGRWGGV